MAGAEVGTFLLLKTLEAEPHGPYPYVDFTQASKIGTGLLGLGSFRGLASTLSWLQSCLLSISRPARSQNGAAQQRTTD